LRVNDGWFSRFRRLKFYIVLRSMIFGTAFGYGLLHTQKPTPWTRF
jgi:hypothetical protein